MSKYFTRASSSTLILMRDNEILLSLRQGTGWSDGLYSLVGGHVEAKETATEAMIREAQEEAGITVAPENLRFACVCHRLCPDREYIDFFFTCDTWQGEITNTEPNKCGGLKFFPLNQLPENMVGYVREGIAQTLAKQTYYEFGWEER